MLNQQLSTGVPHQSLPDSLPASARLVVVGPDCERMGVDFKNGADWMFRLVIEGTIAFDSERLNL